MAKRHGGGARRMRRPAYNGGDKTRGGPVLDQMKVGHRLMLGSAMLCVLAGLLAWIGYREIVILRVQLEAVPEVVSARVTLSEWQGPTRPNAARAVAILRSNDPALAESLAPEIKGTSENISALQKRIETLAVSEESKGAFERVSTARKEYITAREESIKAKREKKTDATQIFEAKFYPALANYELAVQEFVDALSTDYIRKYAMAKEESDR